MASLRRMQPVAPFVCQSCRAQLALQPRRSFASTTRKAADNAFKEDPALAGLSRLSQNLKQSQQNAPRRTTPGGQSLTPIMDALDGNPIASLIDEHAGGNLNLNSRSEQTHRLHVYAHKHNTHITLVQPPRSAVETASSRVTGAKTSTTEQKKVVDVLMSLSTGNIGFRKAARSTYDAAFQLAAFTLKQIEERGIWRDIFKLEVVLRGFGAGREAVTKALLGSEGRNLRGRITSVVDATRLKQGGPRSKKPRRLG